MSNVDKQNELVGLMKNLSQDYSHMVLSSSLSVEDMVLTDVVHRFQLPIEVFSIDTGRLPAETYALMHKVQHQYALNFKIYFPDATEVESFVNQNGSNAFYDSIDFRKTCCNIRKVSPLKRALSGKDLWLTGLRREQSVTRQDMEVFEFSEQFNVKKCNPLLDWSVEDIWAYIKEYDVPYNELHDKGFPSIGCAPCTRAIQPGEDERAGRWWWEDKESRECGLHKDYFVNKIA